MLTNRSVRKLLGAVAMGAIVVAIAGCPPCGGPTIATVASWNFESDCTDDLCGFTATTGTATRTTAFTAGEHAMLLTAGAEVDHALSVAIPYGPEYISMVARCDDGAHVEVDELLSDSTPVGGADAGGVDSGRGDGGTASTPPRLRAATVTLTPGQGWSQVSATFDNAAAGDAGAGFFQQEATATDLRIRAVGGSCTLDAISYGYRQNFGYCE